MAIVGKKLWYISVQHEQHSNPKQSIVAEGELKKQKYYNHTQLVQNENYSNITTLSSYVWKIKKTKKETPTLVREIIRTAPPYTNMTKQCSLCLHQKLAILMYPNQGQILNKRSELVSKYRHENKFLLQTFNSNDWLLKEISTYPDAL